MEASRDPSRRQQRREPLNRERVLRAALALADEAGVESLSMRKLAKELGVEAMSLYNHVANKDDLLDGLVDLVFERDRAAGVGRRLADGDARGARSRPARRCAATPGRSA